MARFIFLTSVRREMISQRWGPRGRFRTLLGRSPSSAGGIHRSTLNARRTEVRPFTPAQIKLLETFADQAVIAIENVRLFKELKRVLGAADGDERDFGRDRQLADRYSAGAGYHCGKCGAALWRERRRHSTASMVMCFDLVAHHGPVCRQRMGSKRPIDSRCRSPGEPCLIGKRFMSMTCLQQIEDEFPACQRSQLRTGATDGSGHAVAARRHPDRCDFHSPDGSPPFHGETN